MANAIEDLKKKVDGYHVWSHIEEASKQGFDAVDQELVPLFKWYGVYAQKPKEDGFFMIRIKIPGGRLNSAQLLKIDDLGKRFGRDVVDITTRQAVQLHWIRIEDIPVILGELKEVGMDTAGGCGDIMRNITGCPLAGLAEDEVFDASKELNEIDNFFTRNPEFSNLPRKYKMSVSGCSSWCSQPDINCISLVGIKHPQTNEEGFALKVGGGLSTKPFIAKDFPVFVKRAEAKAVTEAATKVYRDNGNREKRQKARIKFLVDEWGVEKFLEETEKVLGYKLERIDYIKAPDCSHEDHLGITKLKNGLYAVGIAFISGRTRTPDLGNIASLLKEFTENGEVRTTNKQNLIVLNVPESKLEAFAKAATEMNLKVEHSAFTRLGVACTGTEYCNLAIVETKARAAELFEYLDAEFPGFQDQLMVSVTGCPNNCAQYAVADIGLVGCKMKDEAGEMQDAFRIFLGGRLAHNAQFGKALDGRFLHKDIHLTLAKLLEYYNSSKKDKEEFRYFIDRVGLEKMQEVVSVT